MITFVNTHRETCSKGDELIHGQTYLHKSCNGGIHPVLFIKTPYMEKSIFGYLVYLSNRPNVVSVVYANDNLLGTFTPMDFIITKKDT